MFDYVKCCRFGIFVFMFFKQPTTVLRSRFLLSDGKRSGFYVLFRHVEVHFLWERKEIFFLTRVLHNGGSK